MALRQPENATAGRNSQRPKTGSVRVGRSRTGRGIFARRRYKPDEMIGEIVGELIHDALYESDHCFWIGDDTCLEPESPFRFVNHSCDPNCEFDWFEVDRETAPRKRVLLFAIADIKPGDELTIDYNWPADAAIPCRCRSACCRGWIVDADELDQVGRRSIELR